MEVNDRAEVNRAFKLYVDELTIIVPVDRAVADEAAVLRESAPSRLPLVDACIAGCAKRHHCVLVHRDPHFAQLPITVQQLQLPDKT
jgi:predicted nucleic acid-binding protein